MSGRSDAASDTAVGPSPASPATTMPSCDLKQRAQPLPDHRMVVHQEHADRAPRRRLGTRGTSILTVVPAPGVELTRSVPPTAAARSRIDVSPSPPEASSGSKPVPLSATSRMTRRRVRDSVTDTSPAPECRSALCSASCATRNAAACALGSSSGTSAAVSRTVMPCARPASCAYRRSDSASPSSSGGASPSMTARSSACACAPSSAIAVSSAAARAGSLATSTSAARVCARIENSRWDTASCSSRASLARSSSTDSSRLRSYSRALVRAIAACAANSVSSSSSRSVNSPERLLATKMMPSTSSPFFTGTPRNPDSSGWAAGHQPAEPGVLPDVGQPLRSARRQQRRQHPVLPRQRADRPLLGLGHPGDDELGEGAAVVGDPERRVPGADQRSGGPDDDRERVPGRPLLADRQHRPADLLQLGEVAFHALRRYPHRRRHRIGRMVLGPSARAGRALRPMRGSRPTA